MTGELPAWSRSAYVCLSPSPLFAPPSSYAKAYSTKGTVLARMGRRDDAIAAYKAGLEACPGNSSLLERLREASRPAAAPAPTASAPPPASASAPPPPSPSAGRFGTSLAPVVEAARVFLLLAFLASLVLPLLVGEAAGGRAHTLLLVAAAALHLLQLFQSHGRPQFSGMWFAQVVEGAAVGRGGGGCGAEDCPGDPSPPPSPARPPDVPRRDAARLPPLPPALARRRRRVPVGLALCARLSLQARSGTG